MAEDVKIQGRMYPEFRIRKTGIISRIQGTFLIIVGLGAMAFSVNMTVGDPLGGGCPFALALFLGLPLTYLGLSYAGLSLGKWLFALLQRHVWRGPLKRVAICPTFLAHAALPSRRWNGSASRNKSTKEIRYYRWCLVARPAPFALSGLLTAVQFSGIMGPSSMVERCSALNAQQVVQQTANRDPSRPCPPGLWSG
jgi:hypothetical protein